MVALSILDNVLSSGGTSGRNSIIVASQLVRSALVDLEQIEHLDASLAANEPTTFDRQSAALIRDMYQRWAEDAQRLLDRVGGIEQQTGPVAQAHALRDAHGRTCARLSVSLDDMEQGLADAWEGRTVPIEEVRRELDSHERGSR